MPRVKVTRNLQRFFPGLDESKSTGGPSPRSWPRSRRATPASPIISPTSGGALRKHVNIFVDEALVTDRNGLADGVTAASTIHIIQALSGG